MNSEMVLVNKHEMREWTLRYPDFDDCPLFVEVFAFPKVKNPEPKPTRRK